MNTTHDFDDQNYGEFMAMSRSNEVFEISKTFKFEAGHSLPHLPDGHKCRNLHGHSYRFDVVCRGQLDGRGFVVDFAEISAAAKPILEECDHKNLDEVFRFPTTAENICKWIYDTLLHRLPVYQVHFYETSNTRVTYPAK
jgi:6-pyruvoyltetrahydropterin/6-carboxytetrahydropterin synthase